MPKALVFDLFGTLVAPSRRLDPYRRLIQALSERAAAPTRAAALGLMREPLTLRQAWARLAPGLPVDEPLMLSLESDLQSELRSCAAFLDALQALELAQSIGVPFTVCSNLALPYAQALELLPGLSAPAALSFETGLLKPEPALFEDACARLGARPRDCAMFGDRITDDIQGAQRAGFEQAWLIDRSKIARQEEPGRAHSVLQALRRSLGLA